MTDPVRMAEASRLAYMTAQSREWWYDRLPAVDVLAGHGVNRDDLITWMAQTGADPRDVVRLIDHRPLPNPNP